VQVTVCKCGSVGAWVRWCVGAWVLANAAAAAPAPINPNFQTLNPTSPNVNTKQVQQLERLASDRNEDLADAHNKISELSFCLEVVCLDVCVCVCVWTSLVP
jgi:hypothetical protein